MPALQHNTDFHQCWKWHNPQVEKYAFTSERSVYTSFSEEELSLSLQYHKGIISL